MGRDFFEGDGDRQGLQSAGQGSQRLGRGDNTSKQLDGGVVHLTRKSRRHKGGTGGHKSFISFINQV